MRLIAIFLAVVLAVVLASRGADAGSRKCTVDERAAGDARLAELHESSTLQRDLVGEHAPWGLPRTVVPGAGEKVFYQSGYILAHDTDLRTSLWVAYRLDGAEVEAGEGLDRVKCFRRDPRIKYAETATPTDYKEPLYDQGHMANDRDLKDEVVEQINTYVMSNMSPQHDCFNRGIWLSLEHQTRIWAKAYETVWVVSGAVFDRDGDGIRDGDDVARRMASKSGKTRVAVPSHYYKVAWRRDGDTVRSIAILLPHTDIRHGVAWSDVRPHAEAAVMPLSAIEAVAGVRLHPDFDRSRLVESRSGEGWEMTSGVDNGFAAGCKPNS